MKIIAETLISKFEIEHASFDVKPLIKFRIAMMFADELVKLEGAYTVEDDILSPLGDQQRYSIELIVMRPKKLREELKILQRDYNIPVDIMNVLWKSLMSRL